MTRLSTTLAPPNSLLLVLDPRTGQLPATLGGNAIASSPSAIAIGTLMEYDGETTVELTDGADTAIASSELALRWSGPLITTGLVGVLTVENEVLLEIAADRRVAAQVWTNDESEPDRIVIVVGSRQAEPTPGRRPGT